MKWCVKTLWVFLLLLAASEGKSQYILNGSASQNTCNCYTLTTPTAFQTGSVWNSHKISLNNPFDFWFSVYFGCRDAGADGIAFILQPISTSVGAAGSGLGFEGVKPSVGITMDTYSNAETNDPSSDHIAIQANGVVIHSADLAGPVNISSTNDNVEDCNWHKLRIVWDPATHWLRAYFDGVLRVEKQIDLTASIFSGDPNVFWGFTASTGGENNLQQFCTALDPVISSASNKLEACPGAPFQFISKSESFAPIKTYNWDFGDGATATGETPNVHAYAQSGTYDVKLTITGQDGCTNDTISKIVVGSVPVANLTLGDICQGSQPAALYTTGLTGVNYNWQLDGNAAGTGVIPRLDALSPGSHTLQLTVSSKLNCGPDQVASQDFTVKPRPEVDIDKVEDCGRVDFTGLQTDNQTQIINWYWLLGDQSYAQQQQFTHQYRGAGPYQVKMSASAANGCNSDTSEIMITVPIAQAFAGRDTAIVINSSYQLQGAGNGKFSWSPSGALSDPFVPDPKVQLGADASFVLTVTTDGGCTAMDTVKIRVFKGPTVYVPTAFSPNGDQLNDLLKPVYVGVRRLNNFRVFNRWGEMVFATSDMGREWDGKQGGRISESGTYVWFADVEDATGKPIHLNGHVTVLR